VLIAITEHSCHMECNYNQYLFTVPINNRYVTN